MLPKEQLINFIKSAFEEDIGSGDHTSLACIDKDSKQSARLIIKDTGIIAGVELAEMIFNYFDPELLFTRKIADGSKVNHGDIAFTVEGSARSVLTSERLVLNCMQRMSGISTLTNQYVSVLEGLKTKVLDTRKTTPLCRTIEKWAVKIGGGDNHRFGLFDMILIKDNHVDYAGGIDNAIKAAQRYLAAHKLNLSVEIETRNIQEVQQVLATGGVNRIMLDNFSPALLREAIDLINGKYETEASGGITLETIRRYAETGVDFISAGALTHSFKSMDMSLKAIK